MLAEIFSKTLNKTCEITAARFAEEKSEKQDT